MDTDAIKADIQWLVDYKSSRMLDLEKATDVDEKKAIYTDLKEIHSLISQYQVLLHAIESDKLDVERVELEKQKLELERERILADLAIQNSKSETEKKRIETDGKIDWGQVLTTTVKCVGYGIGMFVIGFVELKANGYLHERLTKTAEKMM